MIALVLFGNRNLIGKLPIYAKYKLVMRGKDTAQIELQNCGKAHSKALLPYFLKHCSL